jgi:3-hydroxy-9,10-secoandrosta-1,3,5(10)-triene-9,17-dione monooxygenase
MNAPREQGGFVDVDFDAAVASARALVPALRERGPRAEAARDLLPETAADLHRTGLMRFCQPRRWGGMELGFLSQIDIPYELARGCASTAWLVSNYAIHHWLLAFYDERAQEEIWGADPDVLIASGIAYPQGRGRKVDGGYVVSGHWNFSSGVSPSEWNMLAAVIRDGEKIIDHRICLLHKSQYEVIDDWHVMGMRATGSRSVKATDVFVPEYRTLSGYQCRGAGDFPGAKVNPSGVYRLPVAMISSHCLAAVAIGNAQAALELTCEHVKSRSTAYTGASMRDFQAVQLRVGAAGARIEAARLRRRSDAVRGQRWADDRVVPTIEEKLAVKRNAAYATALCTEAVDLLHGMAGANGIYDSYPIQRLFRDAHALGAHYGFSFDAHGSAWGLVALGGTFSSPTL